MATDLDYRQLFLTYGKQDIAFYSFAVENNLARVYVTNHSDAKCGVWTLAELRVRYGLTPRQLSGMAAKMRRAIEIYEDDCF